MTTDAPHAVNPHAPAPTLARRLLGPFHVTGVFWYRFPHWSFTHLPAWVEPPSVLFFATFFFLTLTRIRQAIAANLEPVLGATSAIGRLRRAYKTMFVFASCMPERFRYLAAPERFRVSVEGEPLWHEVMQPGVGVILVSAHIGFWQIATQFGASVEHRRIHIVREKEMDPRAQEMMREIFERTGRECVTHYAGDDAGLGVALAEALRNGEIVALQADRPRGGGRTVATTIFGKPMPLPNGPAALARVTGAPILPVFNFRAGRYHINIVVREPIRVARTANRDADISEATNRLAKEIEWAISREPHQWFCFRRLWS